MFCECKLNVRRKSHTRICTTAPRRIKCFEIILISLLPLSRSSSIQRFFKNKFKNLTKATNEQNISNTYSRLPVPHIIPHLSFITVLGVYARINLVNQHQYYNNNDISFKYPVSVLGGIDSMRNLCPCKD